MKNYFEKDLGDGTNVSLVELPRADDQTPALAFQFRFMGKTLVCFLETTDGESFVDELTSAMITYMEEISDAAIEKSEQDGRDFLSRKKDETKVAEEAEETVEAE